MPGSEFGPSAPPGFILREILCNSQHIDKTNNKKGGRDGKQLPRSGLPVPPFRWQLFTVSLLKMMLPDQVLFPGQVWRTHCCFRVAIARPSGHPLPAV